MYRGALQCILSELIRQDRLVVVNSIEMDAPKTRELNDKLKAFDFLTDDLASHRFLLITKLTDEIDNLTDEF